MCRHVFTLKEGIALKDEKVFNMQSFAIQLLSLCPAENLPAVLYVYDGKASGTATVDAAATSGLGAQALAVADYLLRVLSIQLWRTETTTMSLTSHNAIELYPILVCISLLGRNPHICNSFLF
jgi:hypothetical protein